MNKRARMRLIGVTAVILIVIAAIVLGVGSQHSSENSTVTQLSKDSSLVGKRVIVGGAVVAGSWNKQSNPMRFTIREEGDSAGSGPTLKVVYTGSAPNTFGDGVVAIVTGTLERGGVVQANSMITKCPSKYQSATGAIPVADLGGKGSAMVGKPVHATGFIKPGSIQPASAADRFIVAEKADGTGASVPVQWSGVLPNGMKDGSQVVIAGELDASGKFIATSVALSQVQ